MKYVYNFYEAPDLIAAVIEVDQPLPHIEVGHQLLLTTDGYEKIGTALIVKYVRVVISHLKDRFARYEMHVFCEEQNRPPPI